MPSRLVRLLCVLGLLLAIVPHAALAQTTTDSVVVIRDNFFDAADLSVTAGTTVTWTNQGNSSQGHTVTSSDGLFDSGVLRNGDSFSFTFDQPGDYPYVCVNHRNQEGVIHVAGAQPGISVGDNFFAPMDFSVTAGSTVVWTNSGNESHTVTSFDGIFNSGNLPPGAVFTYTFPDAGDFKYFCIYHAGQDGTIHVLASDTTPMDTAIPGPSSTPEATPAPEPVVTAVPLPPAPTVTTPVATPVATMTLEPLVPTPAATATGAPSAPMSVSVNIQGFSFSPASITVQVGGRVTWTNQDSAPHTATGQAFNTGNLSRGQTGSATFSSPGTFPYQCSIHPNMTGTVSVIR
jgi:plastocyanin